MRSISKLLVMLLSVAAGPALASDAPGADVGTTVLGPVAVDIGRLTDRIAEAEGDVARLATVTPNSEMERASLEQQPRDPDPVHAAQVEILRTQRGLP